MKEAFACASDGLHEWPGHHTAGRPAGHRWSAGIRPRVEETGRGDRAPCDPGLLGRELARFSTQAPGEFRRPSGIARSASSTSSSEPAGTRSSTGSLMTSLAGTVALVAGSSTGIGTATAVSFAADCPAVALVDPRAHRPAELAP